MLCLSSCSSISRNHFILRHDIDKEIFEIKALESFCLNDKTLLADSEFIQLNPLDRLLFFCDKCYTPHLFYFLMPAKDKASSKEGLLLQQKQALANIQQGQHISSIDEKLQYLVKKPLDKTLLHRWGNMEKETLKKYLLQYGYGRWEKIRKASAASCKILKDKSPLEMRAFANDFLRTLYDNLVNEKTEKNELRGFIVNVIEERQDDPFIQS